MSDLASITDPVPATSPPSTLRKLEQVAVADFLGSPLAGGRLPGGPRRRE